MRAPTYEIAPRADALVLSQDRAAPDFDVEQLWEQVRERPLGERQRADVMRLMSDRARGVGAHESYYDRPERDHDELRRRLGLSGRERVVSLFTNVTWDSATIGHDVGFASMFDWVEHAVRLAAGEELVLIVRIHPAESRWGTREAVREVVVSRLGEVPAERPLRRRPPMRCPPTRWSTCRICCSRTRPPSGWRPPCAASAWPSPATPTIAVAASRSTSPAPSTWRACSRSSPRGCPRRTSSWRCGYAHMFFFRAMVPFPLLRARDGRVERCPRAAAELEPGADPYLDWICERILDGGHFGLPDRLAVVPAARAS